MKKFLRYATPIVAAIDLARLIAACGPTADASYAAQQTSCVERAKTKAEADQCRHDVDVKWCVVNGVPQCNDAGAK